MNTYTVSLAFGLIFIAVGLLGFTPNGLVAYDGFFAVNALHNLIHISTGLIFIAVVIKYQDYQGRVLKIIGVSYIAVGIIGFLTTGSMMLGIIHINDADRWLHFGLAIAILATGFLPHHSPSRVMHNAIGTE